MEPLGLKIRRQRRRLGLTLDELAGRADISKPYLSLIENGRVANAPSDEKLGRLEQTLGLAANELLMQAHLQRTPIDVRKMLGKLLIAGAGNGKNSAGAANATPSTSDSAAAANGDPIALTGALKQVLQDSAVSLEKISANAVPIINRPSADYPTDFANLSYPAKVAQDYVACPEISDQQAFAARVYGDSMAPKYRQGDIVIFSPAAVPRNGDDCFVRFADGQTTFKRVFFETDNRSPAVRLQPRNHRHRPVTVPVAQIGGLYRAVFRYHKIDDDD